MNNTNMEVNISELESEKFVLGCAIVNEYTLPEIFGVLSEKDFINPIYKKIFSIIFELYNVQKEVSVDAILQKLNNSNKKNIDIIYDIAKSHITDQGLETHIEIVKKNSIKRQILNFTKKLEIEQKTEKDPMEILTIAQQELFNIDSSYNTKEVIDIKKSISDLIKKMNIMKENNKSNITGIDTGFKTLNLLTSGWQNSDLIILAARPSVGKTALALNFAYNAAIKQSPVAFFSLEMSSEQLTQRLLSIMTNIPGENIKNSKNLVGDHWNKIYASEERAEDIPLYIEDTSGIMIYELQSKLHKLKREKDIKLCVIDYLQLITLPKNHNSGNRQNEVSTISKELKKIAKDLDIPIICLSQLSRKVEEREDKRPIMSDLRESGSIEQDADIVMFLYREGYHNKKTVDEKFSNITELIIQKHRNGSTGTVELFAELDVSTFKGYESGNKKGE